MSFYRTSGEGDPDPAESIEDFDPNDPDATIVHYDLGAWAHDDQAELIAELAAAGVPHAWGEADELLVPESAETRADEIIADLEARLGVGLGVLSRAELADDEPTVEYDLGEWPHDDRAAIARTLDEGTIRHRWDGTTLLIAAADEATVDSVLDAVERGDVVGDLDTEPAGSGDAPDLPFETLTTFFLAGERLARNQLDADGLAHLLEAVDVADPANPPYGVERALWQRACGLSDELAGALGDGDEPDVERAGVVAEQLRDLLRPYI